MVLFLCKYQLLKCSCLVLMRNLWSSAWNMAWRELSEAREQQFLEIYYIIYIKIQKLYIYLLYTNQIGDIFLRFIKTKNKKSRCWDGNTKHTKNRWYALFVPSHFLVQGPQDWLKIKSEHRAEQRRDFDCVAADHREKAEAPEIQHSGRRPDRKSVV